MGANNSLLRRNEYKKIIKDRQGYRSNFSDKSLQAARPCFLPPAQKELEFYSGGNAVVFKVQTHQQNWAIRFYCNNYSQTLEARLKLISDFIQQAKVPYLVDFCFMPKGLLKTYPVLKMPWVAGQTMWAYLAANVRKKDKLDFLARQWAALCQTLHGRGMAHGDLHPDNVLITPTGDMKLIDYDSMYVPALEPLNMARVIDGLAGFQHPGNAGSKYFGLERDNFSAILIYTSILALKYDPELWDGGRNERIIADLDPQEFCKSSSAIVKKIANFDAELATCVAELQHASRLPLEQTRPLHKILAMSRSSTANSPTAIWPATSATQIKPPVVATVLPPVATLPATGGFPPATVWSARQAKPPAVVPSGGASRKNPSLTAVFLGNGSLVPPANPVTSGSNNKPALIRWAGFFVATLGLYALLISPVKSRDTVPETESFSSLSSPVSENSESQPAMIPKDTRYALLPQPVVEEPVMLREPVMPQPVVREPVARKPVVRKPVARKPVASSRILYDHENYPIESDYDAKSGETPSKGVGPLVAHHYLDNISEPLKSENMKTPAKTSKKDVAKVKEASQQSQQPQANRAQAKALAIALRYDNAHGKGSYEKQYQKRYGKNALELNLGTYYIRYKAQ
jgi:serine/threonine protein kinase